MAYRIKPIGEEFLRTLFDSLDDAKKFAEQNLDAFEEGYEILDSGGKSVHCDKRHKVDRVDLIDLD